jgi:hypothetical protein
VSCWTDGPSRPAAETIADYLPQAAVQGKGLLSTEAFVSLPYVPGSDPVLAVLSHFFEFEEEGGGETRLAHELDPGGVYSVLVTTGGGLYRYRLHDRVEVTGHVEQAPTMRFLGKDNLVVDLFGEKLSVEHVTQSLDTLLERRGVTVEFRMLAPDEPSPGETCYTLYLALRDSETDVVAGMGKELDALLRDNFHYDYCRRLGQLGVARVYRMDGGGERPAAAFARAMAERGVKLGDVKPSDLDGERGWSRRFGGSYVSDDAGGAP